MALAIDASTPAIAVQATNTVLTATTASFTPPANSLLYIRWAWNTGTGLDPTQPTITDNLAGHLAYTLLDWKHRGDGTPTVDGQAAHWWAQVGSSPSAMTITTTAGVASGDSGGALCVTVITGHDTVTPIGAHGKNGSASAASIAQSYTAGATNGWGLIGVTDWDLKGAETAGTGCTLATPGGGSANVGTDITYAFARRTSADDTSGSANTLNLTLPATSTALNWVYAEIVPSGNVPWNPQRTTPVTDPGRAWWAQGDRRDANTVATPANPLPPPLDTAWQANANYWHLYAAAGNTQGRSWAPQQRPYISDPNLLAGNPADPLLVSGGDTWRRYATPDYADRRMAPTQRPYVSDPNLLGTALLEGPLLAATDDPTRYRSAAGYVDRRVAPQQRLYISDPLLLATALLESPLLGGFDDTARHQSVAANTDRRLAPQQRVYISPPGLLDTAELENELLGGATTGSRWSTPVTHADRRLAPQQRAYISTVGLLDTALLESPLLGEATASARRQAAVTNPSAWWMPHQLTYPGPLDQALLETPLLGAADDLRRRQTGAYQDRREVPQQHLNISAVGLLDTALLEPPLLGQATIGTQYLVPATHTPRWWMPQQPARQSLYFDAGPDAPPLTLAWGAGGHYAVLYAQAGWQPDRRAVPQQRPYISDPSFYPTTAATDPLTVAWGAGGTYWHLYNTATEQVDRRFVAQQRRYISGPALLSSALLENELLGSADDQRRRALTGAYWDRRLAGQQRPYFDPTLMATALLENELLGGATTAVRYALAATHADRRQYPTQRLYQSDPLLLAMALLESPLLGAVDDLARHRARPTDRRVTGWQPPRFDPTLLTPPGTSADPLLLAGAVSGDTWRRYWMPTYAHRIPAAPAQQNRWITYVTTLPSFRDIVVILVATPRRWSTDPTDPRWETRIPTERWATERPTGRWGTATPPDRWTTTDGT